MSIFRVNTIVKFTIYILCYKHYVFVMLTQLHNCVILTLEVDNRVSTFSGHIKRLDNLSLSPQVGLEPTTHRLTADCSTTELLKN